ncbi:hypothetical protein [Psychrobacter glacincola]|uniref:hypothetical protein n=1 Tax=Psychrobacter glacincola TaxID=56810 RepID=UPI0039AF3E39
MSQRHKFSLGQKIKQLLTRSTVRSVIDKIKSSKHLPIADFDNETNSQVNATQVATDKLNTDSKNIDPSNTDSTLSTKNESYEEANSADNDNDMNEPIETEIAFGEGFEHIAAQKSESDMLIVDFLKQYFDDKDWPYNHYQPKIRDSQKSHYLSLRMRNKQLDCGYLFRVQERNKLLAVYGILPFLIPESHQSAAMLLITQINYDMMIGNLEMDVDDGEIRYKNAIDIEAVGLDDDILEHLLQSVIAMTTVAHEIFSDLVNNQDPAEELPDLLSQLRQQVDSRTFFLPTQFVQ